MFIPILISSPNEESHAQKIASHLAPFDVEVEMYVASAFTVPELVQSLVNEVNQNDKPTVWITISSQSNALSGMVAANSLHPVIACPLFGGKADYLANIHSSVMMPTATPSMVVVNPQNAALAALKILALTDKRLQKKIERQMQDMKESF